MLISQIGLLEPIQNQDHGIIPGCPRNPYRFIHTKCPLSLGHSVKSRDIVPVGVSRFFVFKCPRTPEIGDPQRPEYSEGQAAVRAKIVPRLRDFNTITGT